MNHSTISGAHPAFYQMSSGDNLAEAWSWPLTSI